jgi:hypothetical protein
MRVTPAYMELKVLSHSLNKIKWRTESIQHAWERRHLAYSPTPGPWRAPRRTVLQKGLSTLRFSGRLWSFAAAKLETSSARTNTLNSKQRYHLNMRNGVPN